MHEINRKNGEWLRNTKSRPRCQMAGLTRWDRLWRQTLFAVNHAELLFCRHFGVEFALWAEVAVGGCDEFYGDACTVCGGDVDDYLSRLDGNSVVVKPVGGSQLLGGGHAEIAFAPRADIPWPVLREDNGAL